MVRTRRSTTAGSGGGEWQTPPVRVQPRTGHLCSDDGWPGSRARRDKDGDDRRDLPQGTSHRVQPGREKRGRGRLIGRTKGGMNTKLHAICDSKGRPINFFVSAGQVSDYIGARALLSSLPDVDWLLGDRGYDADWFREALQDKGIRACIPGRKKPKTTVKYPSRDIAAQYRAGQWTSDVTNGATAPLVTLLRNALPGSDTRSCLAGSRTGGGWPRDTTGAPRSSSRRSLSPLSSSSGYES